MSTSIALLLTYSMVQSPSWEANWFAASQEIPRISRNPKVRYRTHKRPPPVPILGQPNPFHIPTTHLLEIHPNIIQSPYYSNLNSGIMRNCSMGKIPGFKPRALVAIRHTWGQFMLLGFSAVTIFGTMLMLPIFLLRCFQLEIHLSKFITSQENNELYVHS